MQKMKLNVQRSILEGVRSILENIYTKSWIKRREEKEEMKRQSYVCQENVYDVQCVCPRASLMTWKVQAGERSLRVFNARYAKNCMRLLELESEFCAHA